MALHSRIQRVEENIRQILAELLLRDVKDERLRRASIIGVEVTRDLRHASVAVSCLDMDPTAADEMLGALERAKGWLRRELGQRIHLKFTPELHFTLDTSAQSAAHIESLLHSVIPPDDETTRMSDDPEQGG